MTPEQRQSSSRWGHMLMMGICVSAVIIGLVVIRSTGIGAGSLPYVMFLLCPLMHLLMMRGHGGHVAHQPGIQQHNDDQE